MFTSEFPYILGIAGIVVYGCLIIIHHVRFSGKLNERAKNCGAAIGELESRIEDLEEQKKKKMPKLEELLERMIKMREERDQLQLQHRSVEERLEKDSGMIPGRTSKRVER